MKLNINRFFSDRLVFDSSVPEKLRVTNSFWDWCKRIISWIWSPSSYSDENRRTVGCFKKYLVDLLGKERLQRICSRYSLNLDAMEKKGSPLLSRDVAQIVIGARDVSVQDINEFIQKRSDPRFDGKNSFQDLDSVLLAEVQLALSRPFGGQWQVPKVAKRISGRPTEWLARIFYDPFLADRERLQVSKEHPRDTFETFMHNMVARVIKREMEVGTLIPAPNHSDGRAQFYYVSGKLITAAGMVSYIFHPATKDTNLQPIRLFRGTSARNSEIDGISTLITDLEGDLGRTAYESGEIYEPYIAEKLTVPTIEGGHSLGSTIVQYRFANKEHIRKAYLYNGPGLPAKEVEKFNTKKDPIDLIIRHSLKDKWSSVGQVHLGYQAPSHVNVDYWKYHPPKMNFRESAHVAVWGKGKYRHGIEGGMSRERIDGDFHHKNKPREFFRATFGPPVASVLRATRKAWRTLFSSRAEEERGLKIGTMQNGRWRVDHFRTFSSPY